MKTKYFFANVKQIDVENRRLFVVASTNERDRDGDIILPSAFKKSIKHFIANSVILACHQHRLQTGSSPVIGSAIADTIEIAETELRFWMEFADTPLGGEYWILYRDGHMKAFSIGFMPDEYSPNKDGKGYLYTECELLEVSAVPVPSNRRALARAKGYFEDNNIEGMEASMGERIETQVAACFKQLQSEVEGFIDEVKSILIPDSHRFAKALLGETDDSDVCAGDNEKAERIVKIATELIKQLGE